MLKRLCSLSCRIAGVLRERQLLRSLAKGTTMNRDGPIEER